MKRVPPLLLALFSTLSFQSSSFAQGTALTYQGRLNDAAGPANGTYNFQFTVRNALTGGSPVGLNPLAATLAVSNGLFTVTLDPGAGVFTGADRWLEIAVRTNGAASFTTLSPRQKITAAPYSITAGTVTGSVGAGQLTGTIAPTNIGAGSITTVMLANGAVGANQLAGGAVTTSALADGAVTANKVATVTVSSFSTTFTNPTPAASDQFGISVAAMGSDRVLIGAHGDDTGAAKAGAAYLFSTTRLLLSTFTNPTPAVDDNFGYSVAAVGSDRVFIGVSGDDTGALDAGAAYLFSANGALLATFINPTPAVGDYFGWSVAAVGSDRVLIGAYGDNTGATDAGVAYLFSTNGALLTTFTNPAPAMDDNFGYSVAAVGSDRVLIGAWGDDTGALDAGAAYLFSANGGLLTTFRNPTPAVDDNFGISVTAVGSDRVLIGALGDDTGALDAGAAYLFSLETYTPGLLAEGVRSGAITTASLADGTITAAKIDPAIGLWTASGADVYRGGGNVGIGTNAPSAKLDVAGTVKATAFVGDGAGLTNLPASAVATPPPGMVLIPAGSFTMGNSVAADTDITDATPISVNVSAFYMDINEVTWSQWQVVYFWATNHGYGFVNAGEGKGANHPVQTVAWFDCVKWCNARSQQAGRTPVYYTDAGFTQVYTNGEPATVYPNWAAKGYRLPTEAEWEKAARGGLSGQRFPWGNVINQNLANYFGVTASYSYDLGPDGDNAAFTNGGFPYTSPVGSFAANGYGLNDMAGNVWEWCWDWYGTPYAGGSDPRGSASGSVRVIRGGSWDYDAIYCRAAVRYDFTPSNRYYSIGFRAVLPPGQ